MSLAEIKKRLEEAYNQIFSLVYEEEGGEEGEVEEPEEAFAGEFEENELKEDAIDEEYEEDDLLDEEAA